MPRSPCSTQAALSPGFTLATGRPFTLVMRPRIIGTSSSVPSAALACRKSEKLCACVWRRSRKKKLGVSPGTVRESCARMLPSMRVSATSSARPRPSDSTTVGVSAPGRWMLAIASRNATIRECGIFRAAAISRKATTRSSTKPPAVASM